MHIMYTNALYSSLIKFALPGNCMTRLLHREPCKTKVCCSGVGKLQANPGRDLEGRLVNLLLGLRLGDLRAESAVAANTKPCRSRPVSK